VFGLYFRQHFTDTRTTFDVRVSYANKSCVWSSFIRRQEPTAEWLDQLWGFCDASLTSIIVIVFINETYEGPFCQFLLTDFLT